MRITAITLFFALNACAPAFAEFTSPPWPHGANYYTAGTNKDNRARQCMEAVEERHFVLYGEPAPITNQFYIYERDNCIRFKGWIADNLGAFVDQTRTTATNITYWTRANLMTDRGLPTNYLDYTPWQQLNGVGNGYTNAYTASGFTTLHYGYAGLTSIFSRLTQIVRTGDWYAASSTTGLYGRAWSVAVPPDWGGRGLRNDCWHQPEIPSEDCGIYALWDVRADAISEALLGAEADLYTFSDDSTNYADIVYQSVEIRGLTNLPPMAFASVFQTVSGETFSATEWHASWGVLNPENRYQLNSTNYLPAWRLYMRGAGSYTPNTESLAPEDVESVLFSAFSSQVISGQWNIVHTGLVASGSVVASGPAGVTNATLVAADFPDDSDLSFGTFSFPVLSVSPPRGGEVDTFAYRGTRGFTVTDWLYVLDFGPPNGFRRK